MDISKILKKYLDELQKSFNKGDATEVSYYKYLESLIKTFVSESSIKKIDITVLPKKTEAGNPDFRVWDGTHHITGYIEAKDISITNLDSIEESEQLKRYTKTFPNVILTNFYEFRLYRNGGLIDKVSIGRPLLARKLRTAPPVENENKFKGLLDKFFSFSVPAISDAESLAIELAKRTRFLRDEVVSIEMAEELHNGSKALLGFYEAFKKYLIHLLTEKSFADLYSQTITYGLFAARTRADNSFNRKLAFDYIPNTIGILRDVFQFVSLGNPPKPLEIIIDDISEILNVTDVNKILQQYYISGKGKDPIIHFYETFLSAYDPSIREKRGVYYTPEPVVRYIIQSIHQILKSHFDISDGLAGEKVTLLDPAAGTLTFPAEAIKLAISEFTEKYGSGGQTRFIRNHILKNFYAFELMMAPYSIGHLKISFLFEELGYRLSDSERFKLYLTNTLEMEDLEQVHIPGLSSLSEESHLAGEVKKEQPILVILGNPPYSGHSENKNEWSEKILKENIDGASSYYTVDGNPLGEKNPKWLQDDYVKFLRFSQCKIQKAGFGIVGMITNHSYLDNPTFRGMRQSLLNTFNEIYILDLHGNSLKKEISPNGNKDENVFDIRQGTAITIFVKQRNKEGCKVYHNDLFGLREEKYLWLDSHKFNKNLYDKINPETPSYFFIPRHTEKIKNYLQWKAINDIFPVNSVGIVTARDNLTIQFSENAAWNTVLQFSKMDTEIARSAFNLGKDARDWQIELAKADINNSGIDRNNIKPILYRPFDIRYTYYTGKSRGFHCRTRNDVMKHMLNGNNLGLISIRRSRSNNQWNFAFVTNEMIAGATALTSLDINYLFPLYLYNEQQPKKPHFQVMFVFDDDTVQDKKDKIPNINRHIYDTLNNAYKKILTPEEIFYYIYGIFYCNVYRNKYAELLKMDFPRVPFTRNYDTFKKVAKFGEQLTELHLMKSNLLDKHISKFQGVSNNDRIEKIIYDENRKRVYINEEKYFDNVSAEVWSYKLGGYQILLKYLKDRKDRFMDDPRHYCQIVSAISKTCDIQTRLDNLYTEVEKNIINF
jgi:predicted helicase